MWLQRYRGVNGLHIQICCPNEIKSHRYHLLPLMFSSWIPFIVALSRCILFNVGIRSMQMWKMHVMGIWMGVVFDRAYVLGHSVGM